MKPVGFSRMGEWEGRELYVDARTNQAIPGQGHVLRQV